MEVAHGNLISPFHWRDRKLTSREMCQIQTFPDDLTIRSRRFVSSRLPYGRSKHSARHCQVADERAFFSLGAERPSLGQQAHVTSSH